MQQLVVVRTEESGRFHAHALAVPEVQAVADSEEEAVEKVRDSLTRWLASVKMVRVEVPLPAGANPWLDSFGRSAEDPDFEDFRGRLQSRLRDSGDQLPSPSPYPNPEIGLP